MPLQESRQSVRLFPFALSLCAIVLVAGCDAISQPAFDPNSPHAPGVDLRKDAVSGLVVGHRLMAAEEYELALDLSL